MIPPLISQLKSHARHKGVIINRKKLNESSVALVMAYPCNAYIEVLYSSIRSYSQSLQYCELVIENELRRLPYRLYVQ